ncbi:phosphopantetheine adenylyltransferase [Rhodobacterales bacterium]|nr:phosphopantetheine adenylyltransferase [Rhodobacterales bacterium]
MRSERKNSDGHSANAGSFAIKAEAQDRSVQLKMAAVFIVALFTVAAAGIISMYPSNASTADAMTNLAPQGLASTKTDRAIATRVPSTCQTQAWGAWSEDCAAALTGAAKVRNVSFVTIEAEGLSANETILARYLTVN